MNRSIVGLLAVSLSLVLAAAFGAGPAAAIGFARATSFAHAQPLLVAELAPVEAHSPRTSLDTSAIASSMSRSATPKNSICSRLGVSRNRGRGVPKRSGGYPGFRPLPPQP